MGRRPPGHAAACLAVALAVVLTGCGGGRSHATSGTSRQPCKPPASGTREHDVVVVLIDRSRSTNAPEVRRNYSDSFQIVLDLFSEGHGGLLAVSPIDESSLGHFMPLECEFPKGGFNANPLVYKAQLHGMGRQAKQYVQGIVTGRHIAGPRRTATS
jgi:hypothetical protein